MVRRVAAVDTVLAGLEQGLGLREGVLYLGALGAVDAAYERMLPASESGWISIESLWSPWTTALRRDPRFETVVRNLGLMDYWLLRGPPDGCRLDDEGLDCAG